MVSDRAHIGINGVALMMECVAAEMGWITRAEAQARVLLSLRALGCDDALLPPCVRLLLADPTQKRALVGAAAVRALLWQWRAAGLYARTPEAARLDTNLLQCDERS